MKQGMSFSMSSVSSSDSLPDPSQPFPSPSSSFIPPPVPDQHEFASLPRRMSKKDMLNATQDGPGCNGTTTTPATNGLSQNSVDPPSAPLPARDPPDPLPYTSDPQPTLSTAHPTAHHTLCTQSVTSLTSSRPAPPSPAVSRRASGFSRASSRPVSGMSSTASSRPASGVQHLQLISGSGSRPASGTVQPTTPITTTATTPIVTTPVPRHSDRRHDPSTSDLRPTRVELQSTAAQATSSVSPTTIVTPTLIHIRDYGFAPSDPRFSGQGPNVPRANRPAFLARRLTATAKYTPSSSSDGDGDEDEDEDEGEEEGEGERMNVDVAQRMWESVVNDATNGWSGFKWGFGRAWPFSGATNSTSATPSPGFPSRGDLDRNFGGEDDYEDMEVDDEGEAVWDEDGEGELPLHPGLYRALYAFEPEGTAEMKLDEDQLVRVIGRGGGVGWAVVVKGGLKDMGAHALVPESYLEPVRLDGEDEDV